MKLFLYFLCIPLLSIQPVFAEPLALEQVMTPEQQKQMGLDTLTPAHKKAFEEWLGDWTKKVIDQMPSYHPAKGLQRWIAGWPKDAAPLNQAAPEEVHKEQKTLNRRINQISNGGAIIDLFDGSIWEIPPYERHRTRSWQHGDILEWTKTEVESPPYRLKNNTRGQTVDARMQQSPSETGKKIAEHPDKFSGTIEVSSVGYKGQFVTLANGSMWKIAPTNQKQAMTWKQFDRIRVAKIDNYLYPNTLTNLDNGNTILANPVE